MTAYIISRVSISDGEAMAGYMAAAPESVHAYGGEYLVRTGECVLEGEAPYSASLWSGFDKECSRLVSLGRVSRPARCPLEVGGGAHHLRAG